MNITRALCAMTLCFGSFALASSGKNQLRLDGIGSIDIDAFSAMVRAEVKGPEKKKPARGDFDILAFDDNGNQANFELRTVKTFVKSGKNAIITGTATLEIYGQFNDDDDSGDDNPSSNDGLSSRKLTGTTTITVRDLGNGKTVKDEIVVRFDDPRTAGIDWEFTAPLQRGNFWLRVK